MRKTAECMQISGKRLEMRCFESLGAVDDQHLELDGSSSVAQEFGLRYDPVCICLPGNVKNKDNALKWIQSVLK